ncbi:MAG: spermidine synthase, partial [Chthoniobacterales bacterium]
VKAFGVRGTSLAAGMASCLAAVIGWFLAKRDPESGAAAPRSRTFPLRVASNYQPPWRLLLMSFGAGCIFLALEVVWFRFLRLYVASSATAFAVMLAVALAGIGSGSIAAGAIQRRGMRTANLLPVLLLLSALATLGSYLFFPANAIPAQVGLFEIGWAQIARVSLLLMFPASFLSGILLPSIIARVHASVKDRMNSTGVTTLFNTIGAALGPLLATFLLLPRVGYQWSLIFCAAGYVVLAIVTSERQQWSLKSGVGLTSASLTFVLLVGFAFFPFHRAEEHFAHASRPYEVDEQGRVLAHVVKKIEGTSDTLQLLERDLFGEPYYYRLLTNAFSMSAPNPHSQRYMRLFAYLPLAFRAGPKDVLLICYGCGVTADAFLHAESVRRLDAVDISKEVFVLADFYSGINYSNPLRDSRVAAIVQDGRFFLQACPRQYDIISGEPPPPKVAGSVNLYTEEFFSLMKGRLKNGGIATFWLPLNQLKLEEAKAILRAFRAVFPTCSVWAAADEEWIMMGIKGTGAKVEAEEITRLWADPNTGADLRRIGMEVPEQLGALFVMDGEEIDRITGEVAPLIDNYPKRLTDESWDAEANQRFALSYFEPRSALTRFQRSSLMSTVWPEILNQSLESLFALRQSRYLSETGGSNKLDELDLYLRHSRLRTPILEVLGSDGFRVGIAERVARKSDSPPVETLPDLIAGALAARDVTRAIDLLEMKKSRSPATTNDLLLLIYLYCLNERLDKAEALANANASLLGKDSSVEWLWHKLQADFGFHPPP